MGKRPDGGPNEWLRHPDMGGPWKSWYAYFSLGFWQIPPLGLPHNPF
jgi:hypothetical protein